MFMPPVSHAPRGARGQACTLTVATRSHGSGADQAERIIGCGTPPRQNADRVVREHHGVLIYSGGDDVLAFLPLDQALKCARALYAKRLAMRLDCVWRRISSPIVIIRPLIRV